MEEVRPVKVGKYWVVKVKIPEKYKDRFRPKVAKRHQGILEDYRRIVGFYTDEEGRVRPITARKEQIQVQELKERKEEIKRKIEEAKREEVSVERPAGVPAFKKRKLEIDPIVRDKYYEWVRYSRRWQNRKMLPIGGLQKYCESRKAAFVAEGGDPDVFDDAFDKIDMEQAVDSWTDLDKELSKHLVFKYRKDEKLSRKEINEMIREHEEEERRIEELWREYQEALKERGEL